MNKKAIALAVTLVIIAVLLTLGAAIFSRSINEKNLARRSLLNTQAFWLAEAGLQRAIYDLKEDFENDSTPSWSDGELTSVSLETAIDLTQGGSVSITNYDDFYSLPYGTQWDYNDPKVSTVLGEGSFSVELANVSGKEDEIWVRSTGTVEGIKRTVEARISVENISPWNNAIFGGTGSAGTLINGNVDIRGSVHILGEGLNEDDFAMEMSGNAKVGNNYAGIPSDLEERIPSLSTIEYNGEEVETLQALLRIKQGKIGLNGSATAGEADQSGNNYKETLDGVYITDGYGGNKGENNVYSDNGTQNSYDLGDSVEFPRLSDPYDPDGDPDYTYQDYLKDNALVISGDVNLTPNSVYSQTGANGSIEVDGNGNLTIDGIVYIEGNVSMDIEGSDKVIEYSGSGSIVAEGEANINVNLITDNNYGQASFPEHHNLGIMTPSKITFDAANINVMGTFYAENEISVQKQTSIAGTIVSNYFDISEQVPNIYQVPELANNLPDGMINSEPHWNIAIDTWKDLDSPYPLQ